MEAVRAFIAIDIPPFAREKIAAIQNGFKALNLDVAWVHPANLHLTLKFLGAIDPERVPGINDRMASALSRVPGFSATLGEVGVFPSLDRPRVLWVGLENPEGSLVALQKNVERELADAGFPPDSKRFSPHLTFGRVKSSRGTARLKSALKNVPQARSGPFGVSAVRLYKSQLTPKGSIYTVLGEFKLADAAG